MFKLDYIKSLQLITKKKQFLTYKYNQFKISKSSLFDFLSCVSQIKKNIYNFSAVFYLRCCLIRL